MLKLTLGDLQWAEDVVQETLLRAWRHADELPQDAELARPWLFTVARRIVVDDLRARSARPAQVCADWLDCQAFVEPGLDAVESADLVRHAMRLLSPLHRRVLFEVYYRDRSVAEAAAVLGIPVGTVKSRTYNAIRELRCALESCAEESRAAPPAEPKPQRSVQRAPRRVSSLTSSARDLVSVLR